MSVSSQASVLGARHWVPVTPKTAAQAGRPVIRLATFSALALYGTLRWATLMKPAESARLLGLLALTIVVAGCGAALSGRRRWATVLVAIVALIAMFPIAGVPLSWVRHVRIEVTANAIGQGLTALPNVLVPYLGINHWIRVVIVLGAGVLLLDAAILAAFAPRSAGDLRRAGVALPLLALAVVPSTIIKPQFPYIQGLILFLLLAAFMWGERFPARESATTVIVLGLAGLGGVFLAPRIDSHRAWFDYRAIAGTLAPKHVAAFDWTQTYGPLVWPHRGVTVFDVHEMQGAPRADYWKTEDLAGFDGHGWTESGAPPMYGPAVILPYSLTRWTQTLQVTIKAMRTSNVIAAGTILNPPTHIAQGTHPSATSETLIANSPLRPGASYQIRTYSPAPSPQELASAGTVYPPSVGPYLQLVLMNVYPANGVPVVNSFARFGSTAGPRPAIPAHSPYRRAYALALRLKAGTTTPYEFVQRVMTYLRHGYTYTTDPPGGQPSPLESFLFSTRRGYCQQFAGAMALLLRMGGVPARVSVGFAPGTYNAATRAWEVTDIDAHAWVEAWFPGYGWVHFDPTPPTSALSGSGSSNSAGVNNRSGASRAAVSGGRGGSSSAGHAHRGGSLIAWVVLGPAALVLAALLGLLWHRRRADRSRADLLLELERALHRTGRAVEDGVTLATLESRFAAAAGAAAYVRALRLHRYGGASAAPTGGQRRALRALLADGHGPLGWLRAWWALPPRRVRSN